MVRRKAEKSTEPAEEGKAAPKQRAPKKPSKGAVPALVVEPPGLAADVFEAVERIVAAGTWTSFELVQLARQEAALGRTAKSVALLDGALSSGDVMVGMAAHVLQQLARTCPDALEPVRAFVPRLLSLNRQPALLAQVADALDHAGDVAAARALAEEALAASPAWVRLPTSPYEPRPHDAEQASLVARLLFERGDRERAFVLADVVRGHGQMRHLFKTCAGLGDEEAVTRLERTFRDVTHNHVDAAERAIGGGHLAVFDLLFARIDTPEASVTSVDKRRLAARRAIHLASTSKNTSSLLAFINDEFASMEKDASLADAAFAAATLVLDALVASGEKDTIRALVSELTARLAKTRSESFWYFGAVGSVAATGAKVDALLAHATSFTPQVLALTAISVAPAAAADFALTITVPPLTQALARSAASLASVLHPIDAARARALFDDATDAAGTDRFALGEVAVTRALAGDLEGAWATAFRAKKSERANVMVDVANGVAHRGNTSFVHAILRSFAPMSSMVALSAAGAVARRAAGERFYDGM